MADSDDDVPLVELIKRKQDAAKKSVMEKAAANVKPKKAEPQPKAKQVIKEAPKKVEKKSTPMKPAPVEAEDDDEEEDDDDEDEEEDEAPRKKRKSASQPVVKSTADDKDNFYNCKKGTFIQKLLVRWWYAIEWPAKEELASIKAPSGYEPLDGFKGVFVSTRQDNLGTILDKRNKDTCPNLHNLRKKPSKELKELCVKAFNEQIRQLVEAEGSDTTLELALRNELKEINRIDTSDADHEAYKFDSRRSNK